MTAEESEKYSRQILFAPLGEAGQRRLLSSRAVIAGCGALGSFHASALARAGVGEIIIIDRDYVEPSNLQRQWLFDETDAAEALPKAVAGARKIVAMNSGIQVDAKVSDLTPENAEELLLPADVILDGTDNFETRYLLNDVAVKHGVPWIYGAAVGSYGLTMPVLPGRTACLACIFPEAPGGASPTCDTAGILNAITAMIASLQVADALKILSGNIEMIEARLLTADVWQSAIRTVSTAAPDPKCRACAGRAFKHLDASRPRPISLCGRNAVQIHERRDAVDLSALRATLEPLGKVRANEFALRFECPPHEMTIFPDGRAIIKGTHDLGVARSLYARYVGI